MDKKLYGYNIKIILYYLYELSHVETKLHQKETKITIGDSYFSSN